jgi:hypothetical protein
MEAMHIAPNAQRFPSTPIRFYNGRDTEATFPIYRMAIIMQSNADLLFLSFDF